MQKKCIQRRATGAQHFDPVRWLMVYRTNSTTGHGIYIKFIIRDFDFACPRCLVCRCLLKGSLSVPRAFVAECDAEGVCEWGWGIYFVLSLITKQYISIASEAAV